MTHMTISLVIALATTVTAASKTEPLRYARWGNEVRGIEKRLKANPPAPGGVLFVGSSSIRLWNLRESFPDLPATNVGFGGSEIRDCTFFADRLVIPFAPRTIAFYAGDNDIANGRSANQVLADFRAFASTVHAVLPNCRIVYIPVKPSPQRWHLYDVQKAANAKVREVCESDRRMTYVDIVTPMLGSDGKPLPDLFVKDNLHLSPKGYRVWVAAIGDALTPRK